MPRPPDEICAECGKVIKRGIANLVGGRILCTPCKRKARREENERIAYESLKHVTQSFHSKIAGTSHEGRQSIVRYCNRGESLVLIRNPNNRFSRNAIAIYNLSGKNLGWVTEDSAETITPIIDAGGLAWATVTERTGGHGHKKHYGVNIEIFYIIEPPSDWIERQNAIIKSILEKRSGCLASILMLAFFRF